MKNHVTRKLRRNQTPWELKLWQVIKNRQIKGLKFRRQFKIDKFVVDFCCLERKLIIELDGGQHDWKESRVWDKKREKILKSLGYKILRFWNNDVDRNLDGVVQNIIHFITSP